MSEEFNPEKFAEEMQKSYATKTCVNPDNEEDVVNHPNHYCREDAMECIDEMLAMFGDTAVMYFCLCNVWKYRYRAVGKNGMQDLKKSDVYFKKYLELKDKIKNDREKR